MLLLWSLFAALATAIPITVVVPANDRLCFYTQAHSVGSQIGVSYYVLSGGNFDIDATVKRPDGTIIQRDERSNSNDFAFKSTIEGEYELCFYNEMSTVTEKKVEFDFEIDTKYLLAELPPIVGESNTEGLERYVNSIESHVDNLQHRLQYYKTRNVRNESTVASTSSRVFWFCIVQLALIVSLAGINVTIVQYFFKGSRKTLV